MYTLTAAFYLFLVVTSPAATRPKRVRKTAVSHFDGLSNDQVANSLREVLELLKTEKHKSAMRDIENGELRREVQEMKKDIRDLKLKQDQSYNRLGEIKVGISGKVCFA